MRFFTTAFWAFLITFLTLFPAQAKAGTILSSYSDAATMESALGDSLTQIDFSGTPGDTVPDGSAFLDAVITANVAMTYSSDGSQICLTGGGSVGPVIYVEFSQTKIALAVEVSDLDVEAGLVNATSEDLIVMSAGVGPTFWGAIFPDSTTSFFINPYSVVENFCVGPIYVVDADADNYSAATDCDDTDATINPAATETWYDGIDSDCSGGSDYDQDGDGYNNVDECDDTDAAIFPAASESCDGIDSDCDGLGDEIDADGDGYLACDDCDDTNSGVNPGASEVAYDGIDQDCDGADLDDVDGDGYGYTSDCDDTDATINPDASEIPYNGINEDCDVATPDDDLDGDGYNSVDDCDDTNSGVNPGASEVAYDGIDQDCDGADLDDVDGDGSAYPDDCNDGNVAVYPTADELCNGLDENCDGVTDEGYPDSDADGNADCLDDDVDGDGHTAASDCDDTDATVNPAATDIPDNGIDEDCSGEDLTDADNDGYGTADGDCNDTDSGINPGVSERCDGIDQDCDGSVDDNPIDGSVWYADSDADNYGDSDSSVSECAQPTGYVNVAGDCDDHNNTIYPGAEEVLDDGIDQNCDGSDATTPIDTGDSGDTAEPDDTGPIVDSGDTGAVEPITVDDGAVFVEGQCGCQVSRFNWDHSAVSLLLVVGLVVMVARRRG